MRVLTTFPPNWRDIQATFNVRGKPVIFCYGDTIYNPQRIKIPPELMVHEAVHSHRQGEDPKGWWHRYITEHVFRFEEELPAHRAEYQDLCRRVDSRQALPLVAKKLASPLYGSLVSVDDAARLIGG